MSYGPARAGCGGNIVTFNSLQVAGSSFGKNNTLPTGTLRDKLMNAVGEMNTAGLSTEIRTRLEIIQRFRNQSYLLSEDDVTFLKELTK